MCKYCDEFKDGDIFVFFGMDEKKFKSGYLLKTREDEFICFADYNDDYILMEGENLEYKYCPICGERLDRWEWIKSERD